MADPIIGPQKADIWDVVSASSEAILSCGSNTGWILYYDD